MSPQFDNYLQRTLPSKLSFNMSVLLQLKNTSLFSFGTLDFFYNQEFSAPGKNIYYTVKCGFETTALRIVCLRSNINLTQFVWSTFDYYSTNYVMIVSPFFFREKDWLRF